MRRAKEEVNFAPVLQTKQVVAVIGPAARYFVRLLWQHGREVHFLCANGIHLFANNAGDILEHSIAKRQPGVPAGGRTTDVSRPNQEAVARYFCIGWIVPQSAYEQG